MGVERSNTADLFRIEVRAGGCRFQVLVVGLQLSLAFLFFQKVL